MTIKEVFKTLINALTDLYLPIADNDDPMSYTFFDLNRYAKSYRAVKEVAPFLITQEIDNNIRILLDNFKPNYDTVEISNHRGDVVIETNRNLINLVTAFIEYLKPIVGDDENEDIIDIKIIHIKNLEDLEKTANLLKRAFNTPAFELDGQITIEKIENGSILITLGVIGAAGMVLRLCANLIWAAVAIHNKYKQADLIVEHARTIRLKNDMIEAMVDHNKKYLEEAKEAEAQHLINEFLPDRNSPERIAQFKASVDALSSLIDKGAEFYPSIKAADEVKMLFPDFSIKELIESKTKLLDGGKGDSGE